MTDTETRLATALTNSPSRVYKSARDFESFVEQEKQRIREAADDAVASGLEAQVGEALAAARQSESEAREAADSAQEHLAAAVEQAQEHMDTAVSKAQAVMDSATEKLEDAKTLLNIATDVAWGGTHDKSAQADHKTANRLRLVAFGLYVLAVAVAVGFAWWTSRNPPDGWEWLVRSFIGGPVAILLWAAAYASRESREHRNSARLFKHQSLAFNSLDQYAERIEQTDEGEGANEAAAFLKETAKSLFTNQIDAHVDQIKTQGRTGRFALRLLRERSDRD